MNLYPKTWKLRSLIRAAYIFMQRNHRKMTAKGERERLKFLTLDAEYRKQILKQALKRINQGKTIKLP